MTQTTKGRKKHLVQGEVAKVEKQVAVTTEKVGEKENIFKRFFKKFSNEEKTLEEEIKEVENDAE